MTEEEKKLEEQQAAAAQQKQTGPVPFQAIPIKEGDTDDTHPGMFRNEAEGHWETSQDDYVNSRISQDNAQSEQFIEAQQKILDQMGENPYTEPLQQSYADYLGRLNDVMRKPITEEEQRRRERSAHALASVGNLGKVVSSFANLFATNKGAEVQNLTGANVEAAKPVADLRTEQQKLADRYLEGAGKRMAIIQAQQTAWDRDMRQRLSGNMDLLRQRATIGKNNDLLKYKYDQQYNKERNDFYKRENTRKMSEAKILDMINNQNNRAIQNYLRARSIDVRELNLAIQEGRLTETQIHNLANELLQAQKAGVDPYRTTVTPTNVTGRTGGNGGSSTQQTGGGQGSQPAGSTQDRSKNLKDKLKKNQGKNK